MSFEEIQQFLLRIVGELPIGIAPAAIVFVDAPIRLAAEEAILQRHAAALAEELARRAQQRVDRYVKQARKGLERIRTGSGFAGIT